MPIERIQNALVVCIVNLKSRNLAKVPSHGMVLCGEYKDGSVIELLEPPAGSKAGDVVTTGTMTGAVKVAPGDNVVGDFGDLGKVEISFN